jgi:hypothetical protein
MSYIKKKFCKIIKKNYKKFEKKAQKRQKKKMIREKKYTAEKMGPFTRRGMTIGFYAQI